MLQLHARIKSRSEGEPFVARISSDTGRNVQARSEEAFLARPSCTCLPDGFRAFLGIGDELPGAHTDARLWILPRSMDYLADGDIVRINPVSGDIWVMYRRSSRFNSMLLTEQCNSYCIMCSQPPKKADDRYLVEAYLQAIELMDPSTEELGITGGEPTLLGPPLLDLIAACRCHLPNTSLHLLSNGRMFNYLSLCQDFAHIGHPDLVIGIPLYSDIASQHDFVVQARGAFDQTIRGIMNLERCGLRVELRVVLHRHTTERLLQLARYLARNLPFVDHVALMGLEMMGFARTNLDALWIDPVDYQPALVNAVRHLVAHQMNVSIYNHQLCTLDEELWPYARKSISDWKNEYLDVCSSCTARDECGGFFSSSSIRRSAHIRPIAAREPATGLASLSESLT